jgi:hypothetical protein
VVVSKLSGFWNLRNLGNVCSLVVSITIAACAQINTYKGIPSTPETQDELDKYAVVCLFNRTNVPINYSFRWGTTGEWKLRELPPNKRHMHSWSYDRPDSVSPVFQITFDSDVTTTNVYTKYDLKKYRARANLCREGKTYAFNWLNRRKKRIIELVEFE